MPREADPALSNSEPIVEEIEDQSTIEIAQPGEAMIVDEAEAITEVALDEQSTTPPCSPPRNSTGSFTLREADENPFMDSDSEDELASVSPKYLANIFASSPATPTPFATISKTPKTTATQNSSNGRSVQRCQTEFTPLAKQLSDWMASSSAKSERTGSGAEATSPASSKPRRMPSADIQAAAVEISPAKSSFFEDEMRVRDEMLSVPEPEPTHDIIIDEQNFTPIQIVEEDLALAEEADEMSLLATGNIEDIEDVEEAMEMLINTEEPTFDPLQSNVVEAVQMPVEISQTHSELLQVDYEAAPVLAEQAAFESFANKDDEDTEDQPQPHIANDFAPSEASQEYGDENAIPIDPALLAMAPPELPATSLKTPKRVFAERVFHTVSKVPLKAAAEESPVRHSSMKRSASISRLPAPRPSNNLIRSNTVISYSPTKSARRTQPRSEPEQQDVIMEEAYATPSKSETALWSNMDTPARTPRRDLNTALLKGAVVFVDVHTSEGADASSLFTELLTQMGARCVKSWNWNPNSDDGSKIGITHVVFKDGGKRTLEKAKETGGVVTCVGVGWVLEYVFSPVRESTLY
jgi:hypothetical protein